MAQKNVRQDNTRRKKSNYSRHAVVVRSRRIAHNYTWLAGFAVIILMVIICFAVNKSAARLEDKNTVYDEQIALLENQLDEQAQRRDELQTRSIYVTTKQFIEEFAREKLGLVYEDELIFRPQDKSIHL